ncbi:hypothetical protein ACHQM5_030672 [Ranunculus cassubicifolius]
MLAGDFVDETELSDTGSVPAQSDNSAPVTQQEVAISLNALSGNVSYQTLLLTGRVKNQSIQSEYIAEFTSTESMFTLLNTIILSTESSVRNLEFSPRGIWLFDPGIDCRLVVDSQLRVLDGELHTICCAHFNTSKREFLPYVVITETEKGKKKGYDSVGFEVVPCSVKHDLEAMSKLTMYDKIDLVNCTFELDTSQLIREQERITFTYEVEFVKNDIRWPSRWDAYLQMEGARVHWVSILNSLIVIFFLAGIVFVIVLRTVRRDLTRYEELNKEAQDQMNEELSV